MLFKNKKGVYFFLIDVLIAVFIFLTTILMLFSFHSFTPSMRGVTQTVDTVYKEVFDTALFDIGSNNDELNWLNEYNFTNNLGLTLDEYIWSLRLDWENQYGQSGIDQWRNHSSLLLGNATAFLPPNYGIAIAINGTLVYERNASLISINESSTLLSRRKITVLTPNITFTTPVVISEVQIWQ